MKNLPFALQGSAANICVLAFIFITLYRMGFMLKKPQSNTFFLAASCLLIRWDCVLLDRLR